MVAHTLIPVFKKKRQADLDLEASLVYAMSSRPVRATHKISHEEIIIISSSFNNIKYIIITYN